MVKPVASAAAPVTSPIVDTLMKALDQWQKHVVQPDQTVLDVVYHHPALLNPFMNQQDRDQIFASEGLQSKDLTGMFSSFDSGSQQRQSKYLAQRPWYENIATSVLADPMTYMFAGGPGAIGKLREGGTITDALLQGLKIGPKELYAASGIPQLADLPLKPLAMIRGGRLAEIGRYSDATNLLAESLADTHAGMVDSLGQAGRAALQDRVSTLKNGIDATLAQDLSPQGIAARLKMKYAIPSFYVPDPSGIEGATKVDLRQAYGQLAEDVGKLTGSQLTASDYISRIRAGDSTALVGHIVPASLELLNAPTAIQQDGGFMARLARMPGVRTIVGTVSPSTMAHISDDPILSLYADNAGRLEKMNDARGIAVRDLEIRERQLGLVPDPRTGIVPGFQPTADGLQPTTENMWRFTDKFADQLSPKQYDVINAAKLMRANTADAVAPIFENASRESLRDVGKILNEPDASGGTFFPRVAKWIADDPATLDAWKADVSRPSFMDRFKPMPTGFTPVSPVKPGLGAIQSFERSRILGEGEAAAQTVFATKFSEIANYSAAQLTKAASDEVTVKVLKQLGVDPYAAVDARFADDLAQGQAATSTLGAARNTLKDVAAGNVSAGRVRQLRAIANRPDMAVVSDALNKVADDIEKHLTAVQDVTKGAKQTATAAQKAGAALERQTEGLMQQPFEPRAPGGAGMRESLTPTQAEPLIQKGQTAQELAAQLSGAGVTPPEMVGARTGLTRAQLTDEARALKTVVQETPENTQRIEDVRNDLADIIAGKGVQPPPQTILQTPVDTAANFKASAKEAYATVDDTFKQAQQALKDTKAERASARAAATFGPIRQTQVPALRGNWFDKATADAIDAHFASQPADKMLGTLTAYNQVFQSMVAGLDISSTFLQTIGALASNPFGWVKALGLSVASMAKPEIYASYLENIAKATDLTTGENLASLLGRSGTILGSTEMFNGSKMMEAIRMGDMKPTIASTLITHLPLNQAFTMQRNIAAIEMFRAQYGLEAAMKGAALSDEDTQAIGRAVNLATGSVSTPALGIGKTQAEVERLFGRFGMQWFRSQTGQLVQALGNGQLQGQIARRVMFQQLVAMSAMYSGAATALGQTPNFDITSKDFATLKVGSSKVGFGGVYPAILKTIGQTVKAVATGNEGQLLDIRSGKNPILNFWKNGAPFLGGLIADAVGVNANTQYGGIPSVTDPFSRQGISRYFIPFSFQFLGQSGQYPTLLDKGVAYLSQTSGLRETPLSAADVWKTTSDQAAREAGYQEWKDIPAAIQKDMIAKNPELTQANKDLQDWRAQGNQNDPVSQAVDQVNRGKAAQTDVLAAMWAKVQAGQMSKSDFRQVYSDWAGKQAYFANNVYGSLSADDQAKLSKQPTTAQDQWAQKFEAIQPVDTTGTGTPSAKDMATWRAARDQFWKDNPDATQYRNYIMFQYPTRNWTSPIVQAADTERRQTQDQYNTYLSLPKYRGMTASEADFVDALIGAKNAAAQTITQQLLSSGADPATLKVPTKEVWTYLLTSLQQQGLPLTDRQIGLIRAAILMDSDAKKKLQMLDGSRIQFLQQNPGLMDWYPNAQQQTGLAQKYLDILFPQQSAAVIGGKFDTAQQNVLG